MVEYLATVNQYRTEDGIKFEGGLAEDASSPKDGPTLLDQKPTSWINIDLDSQKERKAASDDLKTAPTTICYNECDADDDDEDDSD